VCLFQRALPDANAKRLAALIRRLWGKPRPPNKKNLPLSIQRQVLSSPPYQSPYCRFCNPAAGSAFKMLILAAAKLQIWQDGAHTRRCQITNLAGRIN